MNSLLLLNIFGLLLTFSGSFLMFLYSPSVNFNTYMYEEKEHKELALRAKKINRMIKIGMLLIAIGSIFQLLAVCLDA